MPASGDKDARDAKNAPSSRARVLAGATEEFAQFGYAGARIDRIAQRVGLNVRMIYYHFGNKEGLYQGVLREIFQDAAGLLDRVMKQGDPEQRTFEVLTGYFDLVSGHPHFADIMVREYLEGGAQLRKLFDEDPSLYDRIYRRTASMVEGLMTSGAVRKLPPADTVYMVSAAAAFLWASRGVHPLFLGGRSPSADEWKGRLLDLVLNGLRPR